MNPYYRTSHISQDAESSWVNDNWDRSTALTIQHQGSHSDWDWESQINISQKSSGVVGNEVAEKSPVLHHSYAIPSSYHNIHSESLTTNISSGYCQNAAISSLPSVRSCGLLESLQGIMHTSSLYVNPMSAFSGYSAGSGVSHADFRSVDQSSRILAGIVDVEQKSYCDLIKRSGIYQTELHEALGLNLGGRTYFSANDYSRLGKRPHMMNSPGVHVPSCQAEGCIADMSRAKHYYRRHKVCEQHSKASHIFANGQAQRFCQQCSRLHPVAEFDDAKRSCRKRLADHNRRRRKPLMIGSNLSKDYVDQFAQKVEGSNQNEAIKDSETGSPTYSIEESASDPTMTRKQLEHETSAFGISGTDNSVTRIKQAASLVSAASWVPSTTLNVSGQLQMIKPQVQAADLYKQKQLENIPKDSYLSLTSIRRGSDHSTGINFERDVSNDIPCAAPWLAQSGHPKSGAYRKSFVNFQDSVNKSDSALLACYISTSKSVLSSPRTDPPARPLHEFTKDVGCSSQWMIHSSTEQKLYNKQLGQLVAHGNSDEIGDADERTPSLSVIQASVNVHEDSQQNVRTQSSNLVAVDFLQQQSNTNPDELDSSCVQPKQADDSDSKFAIIQALRSFESSTYNPPTTFVL